MKMKIEECATHLNIIIIICIITLVMNVTVDCVTCGKRRRRRRRIVSRPMTNGKSNEQ